MKCQPTFQSVSSPVPCRGQGLWILNWVHPLVLSKWYDGTAPFWANSSNHSAKFHTYQIPEEVNLHLMNAGSKISGPRYLTNFPIPVQIGSAPKNLLIAEEYTIHKEYLLDKFRHLFRSFSLHE